MARQTVYRLDDNEAKIEGRLDRLEEQAAQNTLIFGDIDHRLTELEKTGFDRHKNNNVILYKKINVFHTRSVIQLCCGVYLTYASSSPPVSLWGPEITDRSEPN